MKQVVKKILILVTIITLVIPNFLLVGLNLVSYALEGDMKTNVENVLFDAYFKDEEGNKKYSQTSIIDSTDKLYMAIEIKEEGNANLDIDCTDSNFVLKNQNNSKYINKIENNIITLNTLEVMGTIELEFDIEAIKEDKIKQEVLSKANQIKLSGTYNNGKRDKEVEATRELQLTYNTNIKETELTSEVITNTNIGINGENKKVVQIKINSKLMQNAYPVKNTVIEVQDPKIEGLNISEVRLATISSMATNDSIEDVTFIHDIENKKTIINIPNTEKDGKIAWNKDTKDELILTYIYDNQSNLNKIETSVKSQIELYGIEQVKIENTVNSMADKETNNLVSYDSILKTTEIAKGKLYIAQEKYYQVNLQIDVSDTNLVGEIVHKEGADTFKIEEKEVNAVTAYKQTVINKQSLMDILGENGVLEIYNANSKKLFTINNDTQADEQGYITYNYEENTNAIIIKTTKPEKIGRFTVMHLKVVQDSGYTKEEIKQLKSLIVKSDNCLDKEIALKETHTQASLELSSTSYSNVLRNENLELKVILNKDSEEYDLYKNPVIEIELPKEIENLNARVDNFLYNENLEIKNFTTYENENGNKIIRIEIKGEQTNYDLGDITLGPTISILADFDVNKTIATKESKIIMRYLNENAVLYENGQKMGIKEQTVKLVAPEGIVCLNAITNYNVITYNEEKTAKLQIDTEEKIVNIEQTIINNTNSAVGNVSILGRIPAEAGFTLKGKINVEGLAQDIFDIYYSEKADATKDLANSENGWVKEIEENKVRSYLVVLKNQMESAQIIKVKYDVHIPANLGYNKTGYSKYTVSYSNLMLRNSEQTQEAGSIVLTTGVGPELDVSLQAFVGGEALNENDVVKAGEVINYKVTVTNNGEADATNTKISALVPENTVYVTINNSYYNADGELVEGNGWIYEENYFDEHENIKTYEESLGTIDVGKSITKEFTILIKEVSEEKDITQNVAISCDQLSEKTISLNNKIAPGKLRVTVKYMDVFNPYAGVNVEYRVIVENISDEAVNNINVKIPVPEGLIYKDYEDGDEGIINPDLQDKEEATPDPEPEDPTQSPDEDTEEDIEPVEGNDGEVDNADIEEGTGVLRDDGIEGEPDTSTDETRIEYIEYTIDTLNTNDLDVKEINFTVDTIEKDELDINLVATASLNDDKYRSNLNIQKSYLPKYEIIQTTSLSEKYIKEGYEFDYIFNIKNTGKSEILGLDFNDDIYNFLSIQEIKTYRSSTQETTTITPETMEDGTVQKITNSVNMRISDIKIGETIIITISVKAEFLEKEEEFSNFATIEDLWGETVTSNEIYFTTVKSEDWFEDLVDPDAPDNPVDPDNPDNPDYPENPDNPDNPEDQYTYKITGRVFIDTNENDEKDVADENVSESKVYLVSINNGQASIEKQTTTNENGEYVFDGLKEKSYIVLFEYDTEKYNLVQYKKNGVSEELNSDVVKSNITLNGSKTIMASTDEIEIINNDVRNINMGLKTKKVFSLKLDKLVNKITSQTSKKTTNVEYDLKFAKIDLDSKYMNGSKMIIEYKFVITNIGEIPAYVGQVSDTIPEGLKFSSELNNDWYQKDGKLYNSSLAKTLINAGETKEVKLILTKDVTDENIGTIPNTATIDNITNEIGIKDTELTDICKIDKTQNEAEASVVIGVKTGRAVLYVTLSIFICAILGVGAYIIDRKVLNDE